MLRRGQLFPFGGQGSGGAVGRGEGGSPPLKGLGGGPGGRRKRRRRRRRRKRRGPGGCPPGPFRPAPFPPPERGPWWGPRCFRRRPMRRPRVLLSLRPSAGAGAGAGSVVGGGRGRRGSWAGMRAPRNTNQFLMGEKYRLMHLRSDSVGTEGGGGGGSPGGSDCGETEPCLDMDAYLGALENARGALMDPGPAGDPRRLPPEEEEEEEGNSLPYFPSEDDVLQSQSFMERDFLHFCSTIA